MVDTPKLAGRFTTNGVIVSPDGQGGSDIRIEQPTTKVIGGTVTYTVVLSNRARRR